jgi:hypothetical protein
MANGQILSWRFVLSLSYPSPTWGRREPLAEGSLQPLNQLFVETSGVNVYVQPDGNERWEPLPHALRATGVEAWSREIVFCNTLTAVKTMGELRLPDDNVIGVIIRDG